jgi:hypothetical protein
MVLSGIGTDLRARVAMPEAMSSRFYERQRALRRARPENGAQLSWFHAQADAVPAAPLPWLKK